MHCKSCTDNCNPMLAGVATGDLKALDENRRVITYRKGEIIFKENTYPSGLFCLNKGNVMITKSDPNGNIIVTNLYKEVTFLGISDYLSGLAYQSTCKALSDVNVCMIKADAVEDLIAKSTSFVRRALKTLAMDYHQANERLLSLTKKNMNSRIADALLEAINIFGIDSDGYINVYLRRAEIAQISNMSETNAIKHLSELNKAGIVKLEGKKIHVLDMNALIKESKSNY